MVRVSRRVVLVALGGSASAFLAGCVAPGTTPLSAATAANLRLSSIRVDVAALTAQGLGPWARLIDDTVTASLSRSFAGRLAPGDRAAPALIVELTGLTLTSYVGGEGGGRDFVPSGGSSTDYLDGQALVVSPRGEMLAKYPILVALPASEAGAWYNPDIDQKRVVNLGSAFADWVRRYVIG